MKITGIRTMLLRGPRPHSVGAKVEEVTRLVVRVDSDAGIDGLGEAQDFMGVREAIDYIGACVAGRSPFEVRPMVSEMLYGTLPPHPSHAHYEGRQFKSTYGPISLCSPTATPTGPIIWGMSGVEIALCDLIGKALNTPAYNLLGGKYRDRIRVYLDRSAPAESGRIEAWRKMARRAVEEGFNWIKFDAEYVAPEDTPDVWSRATGTAQRARIAERLGAVRDEVGLAVEIALDGHMHYNVPDAIQLAAELAPLKLAWFEDPTPITNPDACAEVRSKSAIPICVGEMFIPEQARMFIDRGACDILHPDVFFCGGLHETRRVADYAELHYLPIALHNNGGSLATIAAAHVAAATRNFIGMEYHFWESTWINEMIHREGLGFIEDGQVRLSDAPGLGLELNREVCERHLVSGEKMF